MPTFVTEVFKEAYMNDKIEAYRALNYLVFLMACFLDRFHGGTS